MKDTTVLKVPNRISDFYADQDVELAKVLPRKELRCRHCDGKGWVTVNG